MHPRAGAEDDATLTGRLALFRRQKWLIVGCVVLAVGASVALSLLQPKQYTASAALLFRDSGTEEILTGDSNQAPSADPARDAETNVQLASLGVIADRTARRLGVSSDQVDAATDVKAAGTSNLVTITAEEESPQFAARVANTFARELVRNRRDADRRKIRQARLALRSRLVRQGDSAAQGSRARALQQRADELATVEALETGNAEVAEYATPPESPTSPKPVRNGAIALFLGAILGLVLAPLRDRLDQRVRSEAEVEEITGAPLLGLIPEDRGLRKGNRWLSHARGSGPSEAAQLLRANLRYYNVNRRLKSVAITSAGPEEGKTTVAWALCAAVAQTGQRALLIETDFRRPALHLVAGRIEGLSDILAGDLRAEQAINTLPLVGESGPSIDVLVAGATPPNPEELLESPAMNAILQAAEEEYDLVVLDTAPAGMTADAIPLLKRAGGVLVVTRLGVTTRGELSRLSEMLNILGVPILGLVVSSASSRVLPYGSLPPAQPAAS